MYLLCVAVILKEKEVTKSVRGKKGQEGGEIGWKVLRGVGGRWWWMNIIKVSCINV